MAVSSNDDIVKVFGSDFSSDCVKRDVSILRNSDFKGINPTVTLHKIIVGIFNPKINFSKLSSVTNGEFLDYVGINVQEHRDHKKIIVLLCDIREIVDSTIYGNNDLAVSSREGIWQRLTDYFTGIDISLFKEYVDAYIQTISLNLGVETELKSPIQILKKSFPEIRIKSSDDILSSIRNIPPILTIIAADSGHFYVIGKNINSHRKKLLSMGGNTINKFKKSIIMFPVSHKRKVKELIFDSYPEPLKMEKTNLKYVKNKLKLYLFSGILYIKYNKLRPIINLELAKNILSDIYKIDGRIVDSMERDLRGRPRLSPLSSNSRQYRDNKDFSPWNQDRKEKLTDEIKNYVLKIFMKLDKFDETNVSIKLSEKGLLLLLLVIFEQVNEINKGLGSEDYENLNEKIENYGRKLISCLPDFSFSIASALVECCKRLDKTNKIDNAGRIDNLTYEQLSYSLALITGPKEIKNTLKYIKNTETEWKNSSLDLNDFLVIKGFITFNKEVRKVCIAMKLPRSETDKMTIFLCASISYLKELSKSDKKIYLKTAFFSVE